jgi:hypothetical protein
VPGVREQLDAVHTPAKRRKNSPPPLPATGLPPRTAAQAEGDRTACARCTKALAGAAVMRNPDGPGWIHKNCAATDVDDVYEVGDAEHDINADADTPAPPDPAASQEQAPPGRGGTSSDPAAVAEPTPAGPATAKTSAKNPPGYRRGMTAAQHRKVFALMAEAFPAWEGATGPEVDAWRKESQLAIARWAGAPAGIASRNDIPHAVGSPLIDALQRIADGAWVYVGESIYDAETGEAVEFQEEP